MDSQVAIRKEHYHVEGWSKVYEILKGIRVKSGAETRHSFESRMIDTRSVRYHFYAAGYKKDS